MKIDAIHRGIVLDHIKAGRAMDIYRYLHLDELQCPVAIIKNARSEAMGLKDIIKIDDEIDIDLDVVGFVDPGTTVNVIKDGVVVEKKRLELPERLVNVIRCKNPRCITTVEPSLDQVFRLTDRARRIYRCIYCDAERKPKYGGGGGEGALPLNPHQRLCLWTPQGRMKRDEVPSLDPFARLGW